MKLDLEGKVGLVTGGAKGIGKSICFLLAQEGVKVIVADININGANETAGEITQNSVESFSLQMDISDIAAISKGLKQILVSCLKSFGHNFGNLFHDRAAVFHCPVLPT